MHRCAVCDDIRVGDQRSRAGRLLSEDVQRRPSDLACFQAAEQSGFVNDPTSGCADQAPPRLQPAMASA